MAEFSVERAVWTAMHTQRPMTLDELQMLTGVDAGECLVYLNVLLRQKYVSVLGIRRAASGEAIPLFRLTRATGPDAPYGNAEDMFCDPNLAKPGIKRRTARPRQPVPTVQGQIRFAATRLGRPFTREEILRALDDPGRPFTVGWNRLLWAREVAQNGADAHGTAFYEIRPRPELEPIMAWFRNHLGEEVHAQALRDDGLHIGVGAHVRIAVDLMAAEGYRVSISGGGASPKGPLYRVDAKEQKA